MYIKFAHCSYLLRTLEMQVREEKLYDAPVKNFMSEQIKKVFLWKIFNGTHARSKLAFLLSFHSSEYSRIINRPAIQRLEIGDVLVLCEKVYNKRLL